ncbi:YihY/virulence factor BrkB family protein [Bacillus tuaregi]|uniref:YihY/virulence factor BrkB family protein n=1 Tax=Bacillus tuaregi TaxID=1816695 RepID=UPI0008F93132|nr:YihY/virulence factor BrkB family protein [Bacillus tuaregi]
MKLLKHLWKNFLDDDVFGIAAQLSYFFLLSLFPLLIFLMTLFPYLPINQEDLLNLVRDFAPLGTIELIENHLEQVSKKNGALLSFGVIGTIWSASNGLNAIVKALNKAYGVKEERSFLRTRFMSIFLTFAMIVVILVALILPVFGKHIGMFLFAQFELSAQFIAVWNALRWLVSSVIIFVIFIGLYWLAPNKKVACRTAIPGAAFATIGWILTSFAFSFYVSNFGNYSATYGSIGAIIVLMVWLYISGIIIIIGGEVNAYFSSDSDC